MPPQPPEITTPTDGLHSDPESPGHSPRPAVTPGTWPSSRHRRSGSHRRLATLPIESWLLVGRYRQQSLLAALVAVGVLMAMLPTTGQPTDMQEASAAGHRAAAESPAKRDRAGSPTTKPARTRPTRRDTPPAKPAHLAAPATTTTAPSVPTPLMSTESVPPSAAALTATGPPRQRRGTGPAGSVRRTGSKTVALTFDDGPDPVQTPKLLDLLDEHGITATFCVVGVQVQAHPDLVRQIAADGHALCNHSWDHSFTLGKDKAKKITADLERTNQAIRAAVPDATISYFRAPGGNFTDRLVAAADALGMTSLYWEVDPRDWARADHDSDNEHVDRIVAEVQRNVRAGSIVLSHDFKQPTTIKAYETLLPWLKERFDLDLP